MLRPVVQVLADFSDDALPGIEVAQPEADPQVEPLGVNHAEDIARRIEEAVTAARLEERAAAAARQAEALRAEGERSAARLAEARVAWAETEAAELSAALTLAVADLETRIADTAAGVLRPFLAHCMVERAIDRLIEAIGDILSDAGHPAIAVSGPGDLLGRIASRLGDSVGAIAFQPDDGVDVRVVSGDTLIETRIEEWVAHLCEPEEASPS